MGLFDWITKVNHVDTIDADHVNKLQQYKADKWEVPIVVTPEAYGAVGDGVHDDTAAIQAAIAECISSKKRLFLSAKTYLTAPITTLASNFHMVGSRRGSTILKAISDGHIINVVTDSLYNIIFEQMTFEGFGSGMGHGIYFSGNIPYMFHFSDIEVKNCGGKGIYMPKDFSSTFENVYIERNGDNGIEVNGNVATNFRSCFVGTVAAGKVGYRVYSGNPTFVSCNGVTGATGDWALFGRSVAEDGIDSYCQVSLIGCNVEDFHGTGIRCKAGSIMSCYNTSFYPSITAPVIAIKMDYVTGAQQGIFDSQSTISSAGATWVNGYPVHIGAGTTAFISYSPDLSQVYNEALGVVYDLATVATDTSGYLKNGLKIPALIVDDTLTVNGGSVTAMPDPLTLTGFKATDVSSLGPELISNGDFEIFVGTPDDNTADTFTDWGSTCGTGSYTEATVTKHGGSYAMKLHGNDNYAAPYQDRAVTPLTDYYLSYWTRGDGLIGVSYAIQDLTHSTYIVPDTWDGVTGTTYTEKTHQFSAPAGCVSIRIQFFNYGNGDEYIDDVSLKKIIGGDVIADGVYKIGATQVIGARVVDARLADTPNSGDATTNGIIAALQAVVLSHGLGSSS